MIGVLLLAAAVGGFDPASCAKKARVARVHLVDGMPFVEALRRTLRVERNANKPPAQVFRVYDGSTTVAYLTFAPDGTVEVSGPQLGRDPAGRFVDLYERPGNCPLPRIEAMNVTLKPSP